MKLKELPVTDIVDTILVHNITYANGRKAISKGTRLTTDHCNLLQELGHQQVLVALLGAGDISENEAAGQIAMVLQSENLSFRRGAGGRMNFEADCDGILVIDEKQLLALNHLPGVTLATRPQYEIVGPNQPEQRVASLKIIPYAIPQTVLKQAIALTTNSPGIITLRPIPANKQVALLLIGEASTHSKLKSSFETPIRTRLERLGGVLNQVEAILLTPKAIQQATLDLTKRCDLLIIAGQTSIMDKSDMIPTALVMAGAEFILHGVPVEPGNLMGLAYLGQKPILCAPGCARSPNYNVVDLILPRLLLGDHLTQADIAIWGLGGLLGKGH